MVHGRENDGDPETEPDRFGVSGYTRHNTFLMYDRKTESLWYPLKEGKWTAIAGPRRGEEIQFEQKPRPIPLGLWRRKHPGTVVLLGSKKNVERLDQRHGRKHAPSERGEGGKEP